MERCDFVRWRSRRKGLRTTEVGQRRTLAFLRNALACAFGRPEVPAWSGSIAIPTCPAAARAQQAAVVYHLSFRSGSRATGRARAPRTTTSRGERASTTTPIATPAIYIESDHMPDWAEDDAREYWDAADVYERANGRLYVSADFALPRDLDADDQVALARDVRPRADRRGTLAVHPRDPRRAGTQTGTSTTRTRT